MKHRKLIIILAYFERYLYLPLILGLSVLLHFVTAMNFFFYAGIGCIAFAFYELVSYLCRSSVYYCAYQNAYHLPMTPDDLDWGFVRRRDAFGIPVFFAVMGTAALVFSFFI